jgi:hypothetical protein
MAVKVKEIIVRYEDDGEEIKPDALDVASAEKFKPLNISVHHHMAPPPPKPGDNKK